MKKYRLLRADEIECRVAHCSAKGVSILLYKTARTDADLLDETVGPENWENDFKLVDGVLYGGIGVDYGKGLIWKWDAGTESNTEAEKGRASDAFKRAGFKHGIGRELYSAPFIWVSAEKCNIKEGRNGKPQCNDSFDVMEIAYDSQERISKLRISIKGREVYSMGGNANAEGKSSEWEQPSFKCADCGSTILPYFNKGKEVSVKKHVAGSVGRYGKPLCIDCVKKMQVFQRELECYGQNYMHEDAGDRI